MSIYSQELQDRLSAYFKERYGFEVPDYEVDMYLEHLASVIESLSP